MKVLKGFNILFKLLFLITIVCAGFRLVPTGISQGELAETYAMTALTALLAFILLLIPDWIRRRDWLPVTEGLQLFFSIFVFSAMFLGEIFDFYTRFPWWDTMLHFSSGILFSIVGYLLFAAINKDENLQELFNPLAILLFVICFSIACGVIWEIFEFAGDSLLGMNMQRWQSDLPMEELTELVNNSNLSNPGLINTMKDIIADTLGSICSVGIILPLIKRDGHRVKGSASMNTFLKTNYGTAATTWNRSSVQQINMTYDR